MRTTTRSIENAYKEVPWNSQNILNLEAKLQREKESVERMKQILQTEFVDQVPNDEQ